MRQGDEVGPFVIERALGSGAMGTVFRARHKDTGQRVAIKVVAPGLAANDQSLERFKRESAILKQLRHPNIVRLVATGRYHGTPFYAMEYVEGESLDHALARRGRITWEELVGLGRQLCAALEHVHHKGIIHRDLKPSNVMVLPDGTVKLTDFGIAKDVDLTALTAANSTVGTASYMSPEQCKGVRDLTARSDLYSLGIMFYELLTGQKPFTAEAPMELFMKHINEPAPRPSRLAMETPVWLDTLIVQLLEKEPEQRPHTAAAVGEALERVREKVVAQQSAGVEAVRSRLIDRKRGAPGLEEEDKEAARTLLGKKKKKKKRAVPFYRRNWFRGAVLAALLVGIGWVFYTAFIKPPSSESLHAQARELLANNEAKEAREGPIAAFLRYYPDRDDKNARDIRRWADEVDLAQREEQMRKRRDAGWATSGDDKEAEDQARLALAAEERDDLPAAEQAWKKVLPWKDKENRDLRAWGLVAEKHHNEIAAALAEYYKAYRAIDYEKLGTRYEATTPVSKKAAEAVRAEVEARTFAKRKGKAAAEKYLAAARTAWEEVRTLTQGNAVGESKLWGLVARWRLHELPRPPAEEQGAKEPAPAKD
jgi:serine/threonine-protein kinase